jgi:hypothetical protein
MTKHKKLEGDSPKGPQPRMAWNSNSGTGVPACSMMREHLLLAPQPEQVVS